MKIKSLGRLTDLIFTNFSGTVSDKGSCTVIQTPNNPGYHWGNYIIFDGPPEKGSLKKWIEIFNREFPYYTEPHHYVFTWETNKNSQGDLNRDDYKEFLDASFELDSATVLTTQNLIAPPHLNSHLEIRKILSDEDWNAVYNLQTLCTDPKFFNDYV